MKIQGLSPGGNFNSGTPSGPHSFALRRQGGEGIVAGFPMTQNDGMGP